jgi:hypothetical protein
MRTEWIRCPICGSKTRNRKRGYHFEKLPSLLSEVQAGSFDCSQGLTSNCHQRARRIRRRADEQVSNHKFIGSVLYIAIGRTSPPNKKTMFW